VSQLSTDDRLGIQEAISRYAHALDAGRWDDLAALFTADATLDVGPMGVYEGTAGVRRFGDLLGPMGLAFTGEPGAQRPNTGFYEDDLVKRDGRWLFQRRRVLLDVPKS
jgi:hypothetical protein